MTDAEPARRRPPRIPIALDAAGNVLREGAMASLRVGGGWSEPIYQLITPSVEQTIVRIPNDGDGPNFIRFVPNEDILVAEDSSPF